MNWNEGILVRHSRPSKGREVLLRQKEYFAKARARLLNPQIKTSPPSISFLTHPVRLSPTQHSSKTETFVPHASKNIAEASRAVKRRQPSQKDDGLYLSTFTGLQDDRVEDDVLQQKRRKLLVKGDWTGIKSQRLMDMELPKPRESFSGPWAHSKLRYMKSKRNMRRVLGIKSDVEHAGRPNITVNNMGTASPIRMIVRIGSRERVFGGSSSVSCRSQTARDVESSSSGMHGNFSIKSHRF